MKKNDVDHEEIDHKLTTEELDENYEHKMKSIRSGRPYRGHFMDMDDCCGYGKRSMMKSARKGFRRYRHRMKRYSGVRFAKDEGNRIMFVTLPGLEKSTLSVKAKKKAVLIEGKYQEEFQKIYGENVTEKLRLPFPINPESIEAEYKTGILKLIFFDVDALDPEIDIDVSSVDEE